MSLTATSVDNAAAVYATLPQGLGLQVGMLYQTPNTAHFRMLVINDSGGNITAADGSALKWSTGGQTNFKVVKTAAAGDITVGCNDLAGQTIANGNFFWMTVKGPAKFLLATTISAFTVVNASSTAGQLAAAAASGSNEAQQTNIQSGVSSGSGGITQCWMST